MTCTRGYLVCVKGIHAKKYFYLSARRNPKDAFIRGISKFFCLHKKKSSNNNSSYLKERLIKKKKQGV